MPIEYLDETVVAPTSSGVEYLDEVQAAAPAPRPPSVLEATSPLTAQALGVGELRRREGQGKISAQQPESFLDKIGGYMSRINPGHGIYNVPQNQEELNAQVKSDAIAAPVAVGLMTAGLGAIPSAIATGASGALGESASQAVDISEGNRQQISPGQIVKAGAIYGTPGLAPVGGTAGPIAAGIYQAGRQSILNSSAAAFGEVVQKYIDEGRIPTWEEIGKEIKLPALFGAVAGVASGTLARNPRALTTEEQIAQAGRQASTRLEAALGPESAPLTGTQQTGMNVPGTFGPGSASLAAQQNLPQRIRDNLGIPINQERATSQVARQEILDAEAASRAGLRTGAAGAVGQAAGEVEGGIGSILPRSPRAASLQDAANNSVGFIRGEDQRLSGVVDNAYANARATLTRNLAGRPEAPVAPSRNLTDTINDILGTLATEERITTTPSAIIGGAPTTTVERIPSQFFNEASSKARALLDVARSPQTFEQLVGLRQSIDGLVHHFGEFAPGVAQNQLRRLRSVLKDEELAAARRLGIEGEVVSAQRLAENRFNLLQDNPIIRKSSIPAGEGGYQNTEQFFSDLAKSPEGFNSIQNLLGTTAQGRIQFDQIRRGFIDSLRGTHPVEVGGIPTENLASLANNFRELPQGVKNIVAGTEANANRLQTILNDAVRVQNVGMTIPVASGITPQQLSEITDNLQNIASPTLRTTVANLAQQARQRAEDFFNSTTRRVQHNQLNPDIDPSQFVRDFLFRSENPQVVQNALNQLNPATLDAVRANAATALLNHVSETGPANLRRGIQNLDGIIDDPNRMQIIRTVLEPNDFNMINDYMLWNRARNLTQQGGRLQPDQLANSVMRATRARWVVDALVGSAPAQNFLATAARLPQAFAGLKPNLNANQARELAKMANLSLIQFNKKWDDLHKKSEEAKASLPEDKREIFDESIGVPARLQQDALP